MNQRYLLVVSIVFHFSSWSANAADWPQWRGPHRDGISQETGLLKQWPKEGPKLLWRVDNVDFGYSTPAVAGGRIYLISNKGKLDEFALALDARDGSKLWSTHLGKVASNNYPGSRATPTVDGARLYALGSDGDLACMETATGKAHWQKNLRSEFGGKPGFWAYAESPLVDGDVLVCTPGGSKATIVALNKNTGDVLWQCPVPGGDEAAYASAIIVETGGIKQYIQFLGKGVVGVDAKTGKFLWRYGETAKSSMANIPTPVASADHVYTASAQKGGALVKLKVDHDAVAAEQVYFDRKLPRAIGGAVKVGDYLYGTGQSLLCAEYTTGKIMWQEKGVGPGSVCYGDGHLYVHGEQTGAVALVEASPQAYKEKGRFTPAGRLDKKQRGPSLSWSYPVICDGHLYIRDLNMLWCYDIKE